ncbi:MAG: GNAT family N-acetyltransferase, partial [Chloroflexi bacterium]|nr:GNAT family N-acetyltransferase [Chloroflexota bacterium]
MLHDGGRVTIRALRAEDRPAIRALLERLSPESLDRRFHSAGLRITEAVLDVVTSGHVLVAELEGAIVALGNYHPLPDRRQAEVAMVVDDANRGRGIGSVLVQCLSRDAEHAGIQRLRASVQASNRA